MIFAFGGDGVFNEVLNGVDGTTARSASSPAGARACSRGRSGFPRDPVAAARALVERAASAASRSAG